MDCFSFNMEGTNHPGKSLCSSCGNNGLTVFNTKCFFINIQDPKVQLLSQRSKRTLAGMCLWNMNDRSTVNTHCLLRLWGGWSPCGSYRLMRHYFCLTCIVFIQQLSQADPKQLHASESLSRQWRSGLQRCECAWGQQRKINDERLFQGTPVKALRSETSGSDLSPEGESYLRKMEKCQKHFSAHNVISGMTFRISINHMPCWQCEWVNQVWIFAMLIRWISDTHEQQMCPFFPL